MRITDLLNASRVQLNGTAASKPEIIDQMVELMDRSGVISDKEVYKKAVFDREGKGSTGMGEGVAIPHAKTDAVKAPALAAMVLANPVDYDSLDGQPVTLVFLIAAPNSEDNVHLEVLSRLSVLLMNEGFCDKLKAAKSTDEFMSVINEAEQAQQEEKKEEAAPAAAQRLVAVTACPTGIAHTYMAAESLEKHAKELGVWIKVETNGSVGIKNKLTREDIESADGVIIAADKEVETARFGGKRVIFATAADGIHRAEELIKQAVSGQAPIYHAQAGGETESAAAADEGIVRFIYKSLMNGVSHMLPFVIGGGILIALSFLFDGANAGASNFGSGNPLSLFLNQVGGLAFGVMFPVLAGYIAMAIGDRPALMPGFVGGLIAKSGLSIFLPPDKWSSSGFFGALLAGFIAGYLVIGLRKLFEKLPSALEGTKPVLLFPLFGILGIGAVMVFIINPPMAVFNSWLNASLSSMGDSSRVILGLILGGMMSVDFGGPINKTAYVFGTAAIAGGQFDIMAAVMIGGMVPPLAIALSTTFFKSRYTKAERQTSLTNYIMGLSFITEGAIPFAASDPIHVIPSCVVGSAVAGGLSMLFRCGSRAPHGGIFVIGIIDHAPMFALSLAIGAVVGAALLFLLKKPLPEEARQ